MPVSPFTLLAACTTTGALSTLSFHEVETTRHVHEAGYIIYNTTYNSPPMPLKPGQVVFTDIDSTPLSMPEGEYSIVGFYGEVVDSNNNSVPLTKVYDHHWIANDPLHVNHLCPGLENYVFGIGAESRNTPTAFPAGYGYPVPGGDTWGGNIHLLHTQNLSTQYTGGSAERAAKECNECYYAPNKGPKCTPSQNGTFQCCGDQCYDGSCSCPTMVPQDKLNPSTYFLRYNVQYVRPQEGISLQDMYIGVWTTPNCAAFYGVLQNDDEPEHLSTTTFTVPASGEVVHAIGHMHTGAINISMFHNDKFVCASYPTYGTEVDVPGNELGHLVAMSTCLDKDTTGTTLKLEQGDEVRLDAYYWVGAVDERIAPSPGGTHLNVMAYMYTAFVTDALPPVKEDYTAKAQASGAGCNAALINGCGQHVGMGSPCLACAHEHVSSLVSANCSVAHVEATCQGKITGTDQTSPLMQALPTKNAPFMW